MTPASKPVEEQSVLHAKLRTLDSVCDRFEREWQAGGEPSLEQYLSTVALEWRAELLAELLQLDIAYRRSQQRAITPEQYVLRLPEHSESVRRIFHELQSIHDTQSGLETQSISTSTNSAVERHSARLGTGEPPEAVAMPPAIVPEKAAPFSDVHAAIGRTEDRPHPGVTQAKTNIPSRDEFERTLKASGVIDDEEWTRLAAEAPAIAQAKDAAELARALVRQGALTKFQATLLYQGKSVLRMGEYVVLDQIGAGGMGQVFKARHRSMDRIVALKVLAKAALNSPDAVKRFQREVKTAAKLIHPNIVTAFDASKQDGVHYLVMEYVPGSDLSNLVKQQGPLPVAQTVRYILQAARGLAFAHSKGVIHRDVKPANLLVDAEGVVKILDMGLARLELEGADAGAGHGLTQTGQVMGTVDYMAPEQAFDTSKADAKADMYSLGCTLYRLLTGENMFAGDTLVQKILAHREMSLPSLRAARSEVSPQLDGLFQRMVAKQPENRPTMIELVAELEQLERGETTTSLAPAVTMGGADAASVVVAPKIDSSKTGESKSSTTRAARTLRAAAGRGKQPPRKKLLIGAAAAGAAALLFWGILVQFKDDKGNVIAEANVPGAVSVEVVATSAPKTPVAHAPGSTAVPAPSFLTPTSTPSSPVSSFPGDYALSFGDGASVEVPSLAEALDPAGSLTVECWVAPGFYLTGQAEQPGSPLAKFQGQTPILGFNPSPFYICINNSGGFDFRLFTNEWLTGNGSEGLPPLALAEKGERGGQYIYIGGGGSSVANQRPIHLACVRSQGKAQFYVAGKLQQSKYLPPVTLAKAKQPFAIGGKSENPDRYFHGVINEARVSSTVRYDRDFTPTQHFESDAETVALYHFDDGGGDVLTDSSGNNHHGKIVGAKWVRADGGAIDLKSPISKLQGPPPAVAPFDSAQAKAHQAAWAKHLGTTVETVNSVGAKMILIPPGEFLMGSSDEQIAAALKEAEEIKADSRVISQIGKAERPQHKIVISKPLLMSTTEVTIGQFKKFADATGYQTEAEKAAKDAKTPTYLSAVRDALPASYITWNDATAYCQWLSTQEKTTYRLPTEAEWEYACRAGTTTQYSFGDDMALLDQYGWYTKNFGSGAHTVGTVLPNNFGLFDMHGNLAEWCGDYYDEKRYEETPLNDPNGPSAGSTRVMRGGFWGSIASQCRCAYRYYSLPSFWHHAHGFRVVRTLDAPATTASVAPQPALPVIAQPPVAKPAGSSPAPAVAPFDAAQAKAHQEAWAKHLGTTVETTNSVGAKMILIPPGEFLMGSSDEQVEAALKVAEKSDLDQSKRDGIDQAERPQHKVVITKPFLMSATEVTVGQFKKFAAATGYQTEAEKASKDTKTGTYLLAASDDLPVPHISWNDATAYCQWLSTQEKTTYRLPTEAEWEYACRAGTTTQYSFGDDYSELSKYGWHVKIAVGKSHPVGMLLPNPFGLFDMHGNLHEWCGDYYNQKWYSTSPPNDPIGPSVGTTRVIRGAYWSSKAFSCRSACRSSSSPSSYRYNGSGFRIARTFDAPMTTAVSTSVPKPTPTGPQPSSAIAPFDAAQAKAHQEAWAQHLGTQVDTTNSVGAKMILIPPGEFLMGSTDEQIAAALKEAETIKADQLSKDRIQLGERPQHQVTITKPLLLGATEVTVGQFKKFAAATGYQTDVEKAAQPQAPPYLNPGYDVTDDSPAAAITWNDAVAYCQWLSDQEKTTYRLPTEAEWEYACRAGTTTRYSFGDDAELLPQYGWQGQSGRHSHAVGTKLPNGFGLFDMHGNVREWCGDFYDENGYGAAPRIDPTGPAAPSAKGERVMRGGHIFEFWCHSAYHSGDTATNRRNFNGFRIGRELDASATTASATSQPVVPAAPDAMITDLNAPEFLAWIKQVQSLPAQEQVAAVAEKLMELNPGFDEKFTSRIENDYVTEIRLRGDTVTNISPLVAWQNTPLAFLAISHTKVSDLSPIQGLKLTRFECVGTKVLTLSPLQNMPLKELFCQQTLVSDLSPLQGMKLTTLNCEFTKVSDLSPLQGMPLTNLRCGCPNISDLSPLQGMPLKSLDIAYTLVSDLSPLKGMPLTHLNFQSTKVFDLSPLKGMPLTSLEFGAAKVVDLSPVQGMPLTKLHCGDNPVSDLSPLKGMPLAGLFISRTQVSDLSPIKDLPLKELGLDFKPERDTELLRSIKSLEKINSKSAAEFWNEVEKK